MVVGIGEAILVMTAVVLIAATLFAMGAKIICAIGCAIQARREAKKGTEHKEIRAEIDRLTRCWGNTVIWDKPQEEPRHETATCHICGKRDFMDNLADVGWMKAHKRMSASEVMMLAGCPTHAHPECAKIRRSDDGKGWVRDCKCKVAK